MNKIIAALLLTTTVAWASPSPPDTRPTLEVVSHIFPPFAYKRNGAVMGPMVDIMKAACVRANVKCNFTMHVFKDSLDLIRRGEADVLCPSSVTPHPERAVYLWMSQPIVKTTYAFFTSSTSQWKWTGDPAELHNRTLAAYANSGTHAVALRVAAKNPTAKVVTEDTNLQVLQQLVVGKYGEKSAIVIDKEVAFSLLSTSNITGPRFAGDIEQGHLGISFGRNSKQFYLASKVMSALDGLKLDGTIKDIIGKHEADLEPSQ